MVAPLIAAAGISAGGSILGGLFGSSAASKAAKAQVKAAQMAVDEQRRQFDTTQRNFSPYLNAGTDALDQLSALTGLSDGTDWGAYAAANPDVLADYQQNVNGKGRFNSLDDYAKYHYETFGKAEGRDISAFTSAPGAAQQAAIDQLKASPLYSSLYRNGEEALLANASATGGLRGGNMQGALYNLGADTLSNVIQQQLSNLGGIANMGQGAAGSLGGFGANAANQIGAAYGQQGQANSNAALLKGAYAGQMVNGIGDFLGAVTGGIKAPDTSPGAGMTGATPGYGGPIVMGGAYNNFMNGGLRI